MNDKNVREMPPPLTSVTTVEGVGHYVHFFFFIGSSLKLMRRILTAASRRHAAKDSKGYSFHSNARPTEFEAQAVILAYCSNDNDIQTPLSFPQHNLRS
jgi:hypothetical protein